MITDLGFEQYPIDCVRDCPALPRLVEEFEEVTITVSSLKSASNKHLGTDFDLVKDGEIAQSGEETLSRVREKALNLIYLTIHGDIFTDGQRDELIREVRAAETSSELSAIVNDKLLPHFYAGAQLDVTEQIHTGISGGDVTEKDGLRLLEEYDEHTDKQLLSAAERTERSRWWRGLHDSARVKAQARLVELVENTPGTAEAYTELIGLQEGRLLEVEARLLGCLACPGPVGAECAVEINNQ